MCKINVSCYSFKRKKKPKDKLRLIYSFKNTYMPNVVLVLEMQLPMWQTKYLPSRSFCLRGQLVGIIRGQWKKLSWGGGQSPGEVGDQRMSNPSHILST